jgi:hypothetical protein
MLSSMFYNLILYGWDVDVNALMLQLEQEVQHDPNVVVARRWHNNMVDSRNLEYEPLFKGNEILRSK